MLNRQIYKRNTNGSIQHWSIEVDGDKYRTSEGILQNKDGGAGKVTTSKWNVAKAKNVGRANETTGAAQAVLEAERKYDEKLHKGYRENINDIDRLTYFRPMLAAKYDSKKTKMKWPIYVQPKLDGTRCIVRKDGMWSRNGKPVPSAPHVYEALKDVFKIFPEAIFDGELYNHDLNESFEKIISLTRKGKPTAEELEESADMIKYYMYDMILEPEHAKYDLEDRFLEGATELILPDDHPVVFVETTLVQDKEELDDLYDTYLEAGYEGQIIRFADAPYENKRSKFLLKRKEFIDEEFEVIDVLEGKGNRSGMAGRVVLKNYKERFMLLPNGDDNSTFKAGIKGGEILYMKMLKDKGELIGKMATVRYQNLTVYNIPRFPVCVGIRDYE